MNFKTICDYQDQVRAHRRQYRKSGIYGFFVNDECMYVGQSRNLHNRFLLHGDYFAKVRIKKIPSNAKYILLKPYIDKVEWRVIEYCPKEDLDERETYYIGCYEPIFNVRMPGGGKQVFTGNEMDINQFVCGAVDINYLKNLVIKEIKK